jgi:hypothetical protein
MSHNFCGSSFIISILTFFYNSTDGHAPFHRMDGENLALVHGQADPDFDAAEAFSTEVDNTRSAAILERDIQPLADRSQEWNFFEEEDGGKWGTRIREFSFQQSSGLKDDQRAAAKKSQEEKLTKNKARKLKDENNTFSKPIVNKVEKPKTDIAVGKNALNVNKDTDDLNYFDALTFKESYAAFSASESDRPREIIREGRQVLAATELTDLQEIDRQYLVGADPPFIDNSMLLSHPALSGATGSSSEVKLADVKRENLNFFDEQLFLGTNDAGRDEHNPASISSKPPDLAAKQSHVSEEVTPKKEIKIVKKVARDVPKMSGSALDYVRKLRKTEGSRGSQPGGGADPVESVGVGIMARVAAATASLHTTIQVTAFIQIF